MDPSVSSEVSVSERDASVSVETLRSGSEESPSSDRELCESFAFFVSSGLLQVLASLVCTRHE